MRQPKPAAKPHSFERPALRGLKLPAPAPETPAMAKTVLIVDDSSSLRTVVKMALVRAGVPVAMQRWLGVNHGFFFFPGVVDKATAAVDDACSWARAVFAR